MNNTRSTPSLARRQFLCAAALPLFAHPPAWSSTEAPKSASNEVQVGRFLIVPDAGWVETRRVTKTRGVRMTDMPQMNWPRETEGQDPVLRALRGEEMHNMPLMRRFEIEGIGQAAHFGGRDGGAWAVLHGNVTNGLRMVIRADAGSEDQMTKTLRDIVQAYKPKARQGFCLDHGCVALPPAEDELSGVVLENAQFPGAEFRFEAKVIERQDAKLGIRRSNHQMSIAGIHGFDSRLDAAHAVARRFWSTGVSGDPTKPQIQVELVSSSLNPAEKIALEKGWDSMTGKIQQITS